MASCVQANRVESCPFPNFNFNVAHHGSYVVLASEPVSLVGVDIMTRQPTRDESPAVFFEAFRHSYSKKEWDTILSAGPDASHLYDQFLRSAISVLCVVF
jgi:phosphopantetheinyl transferase